MKKIISKVLIILIVFLLLFDFVFASQNRCVYAVVGPGNAFIDGINNLAGGIVAIIYTLLKALIVGLTYGVQILTTVTASAYGVNNNNGFWKNAADTIIDPITPIDIFFNKYKLLDINFFDFEGLEEDSFIYLFRLSIAQWYTIMKLIACIILLIILIYVGIRMAISTIADDKAKYKKMLADWAVSLVLIFILQYIIIFTIYCNTSIVNALESAFGDGEMSSLVSESVVKIGLQGVVGAGLISFASVLVYVFIVFQTIIFLLAYMKRMVKVGFLIMISPLISITYSIDKIGDGKAQALGNWLKEFVYTILIQPFHCIIYLALVQTAIGLLQGGNALENVFDVTIFNTLEYNQLAAGVLAIMCLKFVNEGEQIVRKIFGFKDDGSTGMGAGAALGMAAIMNAKKIGGATRKGVNTFKNTSQKFRTALANDKGNFANSKTGIVMKKLGSSLAESKAGKKVSKVSNKIGQTATNASNKIGNQMSKIGNKVSDSARWVANSKAGKTTKKFGRGVGDFASAAKDKVKSGLETKTGKFISGATSNVGKYIKRKASLSTALGIMGAAMAYSSGNTGAMEAFAAGSAIQRGTQEYFGSSTGNMSKDNDDNQNALEEVAREEQITSKMNDTQDGFSENALAVIMAYRKKDELAKIKPEDLTNAQKNELAEADATIKEFDQDRNLEGKRDANGNLEKDEEGNIVRYSEEDFERWQTDAERKFENDKESRFRARMNPPTTKALDAVKNEIIAKLRAAKKCDRRANNKSETLTVDEEADIAATAQVLIDKISLGVLNKQGFGYEEQQKLVVDRLGLEHEGTNYLFKGLSDFYKATDQQTNLARQSAIAKNYAHVANYDDTGNGVATESLLRKDMKKSSRRHN